MPGLWWRDSPWLHLQLVSESDFWDLDGGPNSDEMEKKLVDYQPVKVHHGEDRDQNAGS